ncbi:MAG: rhodanese-related sulfurtransferase [Candidatus Altimarinota bacterium]
MISQLNARHKPKYSLLTFYKFIDIPEKELESLAQEHLDFARDIGLKGRVYIGTEGISSTVTGNQGQCWAYKKFLENSKYFQDIPDIDEKSTPVEDHQFPRMSVKIRNEIVTLGVKVTADQVKKYKRELSPEEFKKIIDEDKSDEYLILDMRNDYEYRLGHFKGAIPAGTVNFREVPKLLEQYGKAAKGKKIIWYCTGGIRCEKAAVLGNQIGSTEFYSIEGGIVKYVNAYNDGNWLGNLYTFDGRVSTQVGDENTHTTIGECLYTGEKTDNCENCRYAPCNARLICTEKAYKNHLGFCSEECYKNARQDGLIKNMSWDKFDYLGLGRVWRLDGSKKDGIINEIQQHLDQKLGKIEWKNKVSQKEEEILEC